MSYQIHPCSLPNDVAAELAAAEEGARQEAPQRDAAAAREWAEEEARVNAVLAAELALAVAAAGAGAGAARPSEAASPAERGGFGRGWIPASRDIGLPGEGDEPAAPLPLAGGGDERHVTLITGGLCSSEPSPDADAPTPNPFRGREGDQMAGADRAVRTERSIDFTGPRRALFLHHLAEQGNVRVACSLVRISPQSAYLARRRDAVFRAGWEAALAHSREHALQVLANRALDGIREEVWHRGELVGHRVRHDSRLLLAHLGRLDARCGEARARAYAERLDELLARVAGEDYAWALRDDRRGGEPCEEILPVARAHHSNRAVGMAYDGRLYEEPEEIDDDELAVREAAEAEWDEWGGRVDAVNAALEAGEEPVVAVPVADEGHQSERGAEPEPPYEVKSLGGMAPAHAHAFGGDGAGGPEFFPRTLYGSSTCSPRRRAPGFARSYEAGAAAIRAGA